MSVQLLVALISAAAALLAALFSVVLSARAARGTAELQDQLERRRQQASKEELLEQVMSRYREPLLRAAFDLQSRVYNIVRQGFLVRYLRRGSPADQEYACKNTCSCSPSTSGGSRSCAEGSSSWTLATSNATGGWSTGSARSAPCCCRTGSIATRPSRSSAASSGPSAS